MSAPLPTARRRIGWLPGLDGLRAIAVAAVVIYHFQPDVLPGGFLGVDLFFVISGYLITRLLLGEIDDRGALAFGRFYLRRARRLLPAAFTLIAVVSLAGTLVWRDELPLLRGAVPAALGYVSNWWLIFDQQSYFVATGRPSMLQHLWSLAIEEQFYLVWPLVLALVVGAALWRGRVVALSRARLLTLAGVAGALALGSTAAMTVLAVRSDVPYGADSSRVYFGTGTHSMGLLIGSAAGALALACRFNRSRPRIVRGAFGSDAAAAAALLALVAVMRRVDYFDPALYRGGFLLVSLLCVVAVVGVPRRGSLVGWLLERAPLRWLGRRSYSIYLWHWPVAVVTRPELDVNLSWPQLLVLRLVITVALAEASFRWIERPFRAGGLAGLARAWRLDQLSPATRSRLAPSALVCGLAVVAAIGSGLVPRLLPSEAATPHPVSATRPITAPAAPSSSTPAVRPQPRPDGTPTSADRSDPTHPTGPPPPARHQRSSTGAEPGQGAHAPATAQPPVSAFGDSVMLGAAPELRARLGHVTVDAVEGRQAKDVFADIRDRHAEGTLAPVVVIHTGDNGIISADGLAATLHLLADRRRVVVLTDHVPRDWERPNNVTLARVVGRFSNTVLLDWHQDSDGHSGWFYRDGLHLRPAGAGVYARLIAAAVNSA